MRTQSMAGELESNWRGHKNGALGRERDIGNYKVSVLADSLYVCNSAWHTG
jgi:hypothetical protein